MSIANSGNAPTLRQLVGKRVVVFGGSSGIGYSVAKAALEHGSTVVIASSSQDKIDAAVATLLESNPAFNGAISGLSCDARDPADLERLWDRVEKFDHLIWTAGRLVTTTPFIQQDLATMKSHFDVLFWGPFLSAKYVHQKDLINPGGSITMSIGTSERKPRKGWVMVGSALGAVDSATRGLAAELAPIRVNTIAAGTVDTPLWEPIMTAKQKAAHFKTVAEKSLVGHVAQPDEIAEAYLFAMKCKNLTGVTIDVEGGRLLTY